MQIHVYYICQFTEIFMRDEYLLNYLGTVVI